MSKKKIAVLQISIALFFAAAMIASASLLTNSVYASYSDTIVFVLIALWFIPFSWLSSYGKSGERATLKSEYVCLKRKVAGLFNQG